MAVIEFADFQCPDCARFNASTLPEIDKMYVEPGKVLLAFRYFPSERLYPFAQKAAESAECAANQGRFWEMHDRLFLNQPQLDSSAFIRMARALHLDERKFQTCLNGEATDRVRQDLGAAAGLQVFVAPTFFVGTIQPDGRVSVYRRMAGPLPLRRFQDVVDKLLEPSTGTGEPK